MVLLQYAEDDGEIILHDVWREPVGDTLALLEGLTEKPICFFNAAFDWFHICKIFTMFSMLEDPEAIPSDCIEELAIIEERARYSPLCIKPVATLDLMLHARKGPYQSLMERSDIKVRRVPTRLAEPLQRELERRVQLDGIYFARRKDQTLPHWAIRDAYKTDGEVDPNFKNIVLKFHASGSLKVLAEHALGHKDILKFGEIEVNEKFRPKELGYAPYALAVGRPGAWNWAWPEVLERHIEHWGYNRLARQYAENDVVYTRDLYHFFDEPEAGDDDSELACMVAAARWRGFNVDIDKLKTQRAVCAAAKGSAPTSPNGVKGYLNEVMSPLEQKVLYDGTGKVILESIAKWEKEGVRHPAAERSEEVLAARFAAKEIETLDKLIKAGRFHASFKVIGALSSRMSGADGLNAQGIKSTDEVRECFDLADPGSQLSGGDFESFEVTISEAVYKDPQLRKDLTIPEKCTVCDGDDAIVCDCGGKNEKCKECNGHGKCKVCDGTGEYLQKIHGIFAQELFDMSYQDVIATKGTQGDKYKKGKGGIFAMNYGGTSYTLQKRLGVSEEVGDKAYEGFGKRYPGIAESRKRISDMFCSMRQPAGIGSAVEWHEPADKIESLLGFPRFFTLENRICRALFDLAQEPPKAWRNVKIKVQRRDRLQTASGAVQSALYAAAFAIQGSNMRAAANHEIQSTGAQITKYVQRRIWDLQPPGVNLWCTQPLNVHDEIMCVCAPEYVDAVRDLVGIAVETFVETVPLIKMEWSSKLTSWAGK